MFSYVMICLPWLYLRTINWHMRKKDVFKYNCNKIIRKGQTLLYDPQITLQLIRYSHLNLICVRQKRDVIRVITNHVFYASHHNYQNMGNTHLTIIEYILLLWFRVSEFNPLLLKDLHCSIYIKICGEPNIYHRENESIKWMDKTGSLFNLSA